MDTFKPHFLRTDTLEQTSFTFGHILFTWTFLGHIFCVRILLSIFCSYGQFYACFVHIDTFEHILSTRTLLGVLCSYEQVLVYFLHVETFGHILSIKTLKDTLKDSWVHRNIFGHILATCTLSSLILSLWLLLANFDPLRKLLGICCSNRHSWVYFF